jgi:hypothetical protein
VDATTSITVIDTTIFIIDLRYKRDKHFAANRAFLEWVAQTRSGVTTLFNLLEVCGILSFNLNEKQLQELFSYFSQRYAVEVLPHATLQSPLPALQTQDLIRIISGKAKSGHTRFVQVCSRPFLRSVRAAHATVQVY